MKEKMMGKLLAGARMLLLLFAFAFLLFDARTVVYAAEDGWTQYEEFEDEVYGEYRFPGTDIAVKCAVENGGMVVIGARTEEEAAKIKGNLTIPADIGGYPVTVIGKMAFLECEGLTGMTLPDTVTTIEEKAFDGCKNLKTINIPDSVTSVGEYAFAYCDFERITLSKSLTSISGAMFHACSSLKSVTIPDSVTVINGYAFNRCTSLESVKIPDSVTSIGKSAFFACSSLKSVTIPDSVTSIGAYAFSGCTSLTRATLPKKLDALNKETFKNCSSLKSIVIPDGVTKLDGSVFSGCSSLHTVTIPKSVTSIASSVFAGTAVTSINYDGSEEDWAAIQMSGETKKTLPASAVSYADQSGKAKVKSIKLSATSYTYNGKAKKPSVTAVDTDGKTISGKYYTVSYKNNINAGTATVTVKFKGSYSGEKKAVFTIKPARITDLKLSSTSCTYTGKARKPSVTAVNAGGKKIAEKYYTVSYKNNVDAGKASVTVKFKGNYTGTVTKTFTIKPVRIKSLKLSSTSCTYTGKARKPSVTAVGANGKTISEKYYAVTYKNNKNVGKATVTVKCKGNYSGTVKKTFTIKPPKTVISKITGKSRGFTLRWRENAAQTSGYQIQYSTGKAFKKADTESILVKKASGTSKTVKKLKAKTRYYVRVRAYKTVKVNGKSTRIYSVWSPVKQIVTKK